MGGATGSPFIIQSDYLGVAASIWESDIQRLLSTWEVVHSLSEGI